MVIQKVLQESVYVYGVVLIKGRGNGWNQHFIKNDIVNISREIKIKNKTSK